MKKLLTIALIAMLAFDSEAALAQGKGKGKAKGKPSFVDEKHRAHAEWKREKEYAKAEKKSGKHHKDDDRWYERGEDRRDSRTDTRTREEKEREWKRQAEERRREERTREGSGRTVRDIILERTGRN